MKNTYSAYLTVKDYTVSGEQFELLYNEELEMLETHPAPLEEHISKYYKSDDYISHTDTKRNVFELAYRVIRKKALRKKLRLINRFNSGNKTLLDIGCGTGDFLEVAKKDNWNVKGIEPNHKARLIANNKTDNAVYEPKHLEKLKPNSFDVITLWHVLEHLPDLEKHIKLFNHLLKTNGVLIIAVPNFKSFDAKYYKSFWAAYDVPRHLWHFSRNAIKKLFERECMHLIKTLPMVYDAYYVSLLSEKYKSGFMNPFKAFWIGLQSNLNAKHNREYSSLIYIIKPSET